MIKSIIFDFDGVILDSTEIKTKAFAEIYKKHGILIDPHTAVGVGVAKKVPLNGKTLILSTAHPSKFSDVVMKETGIKPDLPESLKGIMIEKERYEKLPKDLKNIQNYILTKI